MFTSKWYWNGIEIDALTNEQAGDALRYFLDHHTIATGEMPDIARQLRRINYSGRGLTDEELKQAGVE